MKIFNKCVAWEVLLQTINRFKGRVQFLRECLQLAGSIIVCDL